MPARTGVLVANEVLSENLIAVGDTLPLRGNRILGGQKPKVVFGTSGLWNTFEMLIATKAAASLNLDLVWFHYPSAYTIIDQLNLTSYPSAQLLLGLNPVSFNQQFNIQRQTQNALWVQKTLGEWFARANSLGVSIRTMPFEKIIEETGVWDMSVIDFVTSLNSIRKGAFRALNLIKNFKLHAVNTNSRKALAKFKHSTIGEIHEQNGWLSGAGIHFVLRQLASFGVFIEIIPNLSRGNVYEMYQGVNKDFRAILTARFHLRAQGQEPQWASVCPVVFQELMQRWGEEKSRALAQKLWEAIKIAPEPLKDKSFVLTPKCVYPENS